MQSLERADAPPDSRTGRQLGVALARLVDAADAGIGLGPDQSPSYSVTYHWWAFQRRLWKALGQKPPMFGATAEKILSQ